MNVTFVNVIWLCVFTLKLFGLIDLTWWIVAPFSIMAALCMMAERK